jgi:hypothetical protein
MKTGDIVIYKGMLGRVVKSNQLYKFHPVNYGRCYFDTLDTITEDMVREASHHEKVRLISEEFTWGRILDIHCVNNYQIIEYENKGTKEILWHGYINYNDINISYQSLDSALIGCIGYKYEGGNGRAASYFEKMIGLNKENQAVTNKENSLKKTASNKMIYRQYEPIPIPNNLSLNRDEIKDLMSKATRYVTKTYIDPFHCKVLLDYMDIINKDELDKKDLCYNKISESLLNSKKSESEDELLLKAMNNPIMKVLTAASIVYKAIVAENQNHSDE